MLFRNFSIDYLLCLESFRVVHLLLRALSDSSTLHNYYSFVKQIMSATCKRRFGRQTENMSRLSGRRDFVIMEIVWWQRFSH